jgi:hydroxymethylglutaryl-CoA reductase
MAIVESSIVASASYMAKLAKAGGGFTAHASAPEIIGLKQVLDLVDVHTARLQLLEQHERLLGEAVDFDNPDRPLRIVDQMWHARCLEFESLIQV